MMIKYAGLVMGAVALVLISLLPGRAGIQPAPEEPRLITVTGDAEVRVVPDEVILTLGVETRDEELLVAKNENDKRVAQILALTEKYGIEDKHVQTDHVSIEPRYRDSYEKLGFVAYLVRKTIVVTLRDITRFEDLLADVLVTGATHVHGIRFRTTELRAHKDQARTLAMVAAREKATDMAKALGHKVGEPHAIREDHSGWWSWYGSWWGAGWGGGMAQNVVQNVESGGPLPEGSIAPGQIAVNARVTVSFEIK